VPEFSPETRARLQAFLPATASVGNPVDMVASAGPAEYSAAIETVLAAPDNDAVIVIVTPVDPSCSRQIVEAIQEGIARARAAGATAKPILACVMAEAPSRISLHAGAERIPTYTFPENAVRALGKVSAYAAWRSQPAGLFWGFDDIHLEDARGICRSALAARGDTWLTDQETWDVLHAFALPAAVRSLARTADEAVAFASVIGLPVAAKLASAKVSHKTELGVVRLNLTTPQEVRQAFTDIVALASQAVGADGIDGVVIQPMINGGVETLVGIAHDRVFGPLVAFGIGGINVEAFGDVRFRVAPLTDRDADELLHEIRGVALLKGHRGRPPADIDALRDVVLRVSRLAEEVPEIAELDLNPVIALPPGHGCRIVDARIRVANLRRFSTPASGSA
jgi:acyl-CoA synthetase (NDP forming)